MSLHNSFVADLIADLYATNDMSNGVVITVEGNTTRYDIPCTTYVFDTSSTATDDGFNVIQPTARVGAGRWLRQNMAQLQGNWTQSTSTALDYITNKPSLATVATSGVYSDLTSKPTIPSTTDQVSEGTTNKYYTDTRVKSTLSGGTGITYNSSTGVIANSAMYTAPTWSTPTRTLSTTGSNNTFTISTTRNALVTYTITFAAALTLTTSNGKVQLDHSLDGGTTWILGPSVSQVFSLSITIATSQDLTLHWLIPANALVRINRLSNTNVTITLGSNQQEVLF